jgi:hypothetical protein
MFGEADEVNVTLPHDLRIMVVPAELGFEKAIVPVPVTVIEE